MNATQASVTSEPTVGSYLEEWLAHMRGRVRPKTYAGYEVLLRHHAILSLGPIGLGEIEPLEIQRLYAERMGPPTCLASGTVVNLHLVLHQAFARAVRWGLIGANPVEGAQPPRARRREPFVVDAALAMRILDEVKGTPMEVPVSLAIATGMRRGELLGLRWADLDEGLTVAHVGRSLQITSEEGMHFTPPKTKRSRRTVELPEMVRPMLRAHRLAQAELAAQTPGWVDQDLVVAAKEGGPMNPGTLSSGWYAFRRRRGLPPVRFHDLRHGHATLMLIQGVHPKVVSERLGHASIGITLDIYSHVLPSMQSEAVRAFDALFSAEAT